MCVFIVLVPLSIPSRNLRRRKRGKVNHRIELKFGQRGLLLAGKVLIIL